MSQIEVFYSDICETMPLISLQLNYVFKCGIVAVFFVGNFSEQDINVFHL